MRKRIFTLSYGLILLASGCAMKNKSNDNLLPDSANFKQVVAGKPVELYVLKNSAGMCAAITNYGGRLVSLLVPDKKKDLTNVVVGFDSLSGYINSAEPYFGATIGRYGNRIARGNFSLEGKEYQLSVNNGPNTLHGGKAGFQYKVWDAVKQGDSVLTLTYRSVNGEQGFPGNLQASVTYTLTSDNRLKLDYRAVTDQTTVLNLTNHAFFNLNGEGSGTINHHLLRINASRYTPVDATLIPTGQLEPVKDTPFDFSTPVTIGERVDIKNEQLRFGKGYDHNYVLNASGLDVLAAEVEGEKTGIVMRVYTTEPGLQFYGGNFMQGKNKLRKGMDDFRTAFCLETQHFPDSPNQPTFPTTILKPGQVYESHSVYAFSVPEN
ncbi:aldose epimerase family protein [Pedobacter hiemivivus]|uniref:Aldose 1-epimerase n=1 Tax=Pedobacter hiemivivus TaxID=2530454 RepID=A0A4R0N0B8_9SPHI|nr:aldose epimerase family protein [Pedobacter hiemivivus]TCC93129.1 galactose mutarotase [Pedobacter hiemivivus]